MTAIVGPSGAGKTTVADLIPRLLNQLEGKILVDGTDISDVHPEAIRDNISYLSQNPYLFKGTIRENITFGLEGKSQKEIEKACEQAGALQFIQKLDKKFDSILTSGGSNISGGQRQRLAIARAFLKAAPILIFDEPTSSLDFETEKTIIKSLGELCRSEGCTIIIITHNVKTASDCDNLIVVENGHVQIINEFKNTPEDNNWFNKFLTTEIGR